jgi:hypothetical protein
MRFRDEYWRTVGGAGEVDAVERMEGSTFGVDHAEVGGWILEAWNLPPTIVEAVRHHHDEAPRAGVAGVLAIADRLIAWTELENGAVRPEAEALFARVADRGVTPEVWHEVVVRLVDGGELAALSRVDG